MEIKRKNRGLKADKDWLSDETESQKKPLKFLVHVPKTAGSSINAALKLHNPNGQFHCEAIIDKDEEFAEIAGSADWLSGHVDLVRANKVLEAATDREVQYYACVRYPRYQVASHYNWLMEIYYKGSEFYERHPPRIKEISEKLRGADNNSVHSIIENLREYAGLFLNLQSRFILGRGFNWNPGKLYQRLNEYTMLADSKDAYKLASAILDTESFEFSNRNESTYRFDKTLFDHPDMVKFLRENNTLDDILYGLISSVGGQSSENFQ